MSRIGRRRASRGKRVWQRPVIECREVRSEVTAYAGDDGGSWSTR